MSNSWVESRGGMGTHATTITHGDRPAWISNRARRCFLDAERSKEEKARKRRTAHWRHGTLECHSFFHGNGGNIGIQPRPATCRHPLYWGDHIQTGRSATLVVACEFRRSGLRKRRRGQRLSLKYYRSVPVMAIHRWSQLCWIGIGRRAVVAASAASRADRVAHGRRQRRRQHERHQQNAQIGLFQRHSQ